MNENGNCNHGGYEAPGLNATTISTLIVDINICRRAESQSNRVLKKAAARIKKFHSRFVNAEGKSMVLAYLFAASTKALLAGNISSAETVCQATINIQAFAWRDKPTTICRLNDMSEQIRTERGLTLYLAGKIPCNCLDRMKENAKNQVKTAFCKTCKAEKPLKELFQCSGCHAASYCSPKCQQKDWKVHKRSCAIGEAVGGGEKPKVGAVLGNSKTGKGKKGKSGRKK